MTSTQEMPAWYTQMISQMWAMYGRGAPPLGVLLSYWAVLSDYPQDILTAATSEAIKAAKFSPPSAPQIRVFAASKRKPKKESIECTAEPIDTSPPLSDGNPFAIMAAEWGVCGEVSLAEGSARFARIINTLSGEGKNKS
jgi:hypothetical protein